MGRFPGYGSMEESPRPPGMQRNPEGAILITGGTGLIGRRLVQALSQRHPQRRLHLLSRRDQPAVHGSNRYFFAWSPDHGTLDPRALEGVNTVLHLAGETVAQRWTPAVRARIRHSRIGGLTLIQKMCEEQGLCPRVVSASAIGGYASSPDLQDEHAPFGQGFIETVVADWESAAQSLGALGGGHVCLRLGLVLTPKGGVLGRLLPLYRMGLGSPLSPGTQWQSWIHIDDVVGLFLHALDTPDWSGAYNAVSPHPVRQANFSAELAGALRRPHWLPRVPRIALRILYGEAAHALLASHRIQPARTESEGYAFQHPHLKEALAHLLHS